MGGRGSAGVGMSGITGNSPAPVIEAGILNAIRDAPAQLLSYVPGTQKTPAGYVRLAHVREALPNVPREKLDSVLRRLAVQHRITLTSNDHPRGFMSGDRAAAIRFGDQWNHWIKVGGL